MEIWLFKKKLICFCFSCCSANFLMCHLTGWSLRFSKNSGKLKKCCDSITVTLKMKCCLIFLLLLGMITNANLCIFLFCSACFALLIRNVCFAEVLPLRGQQKIHQFEHILLRFAFPSFYNGHNKSCCKLYPGGCYKLVDSSGFTCELLRGRVTKTENDGWIEFRISNVQFSDGGYYRCIVLGTQNHIYSDYYVEVSGNYSYNFH